MPDFSELSDFLRFLPGLAANVEAAQHRGREAAVEIVRQEVVATLGEYQAGGTGPFPAWAALQDATRTAASRHGFDVGAPELETGALRGSISAGVERDGRAAVGVADEMVGNGTPGNALRNIGDVAVAQELGTAVLPQRSFLGVGAFRSAQRAAEAFVLPVIAALSGAPPSNRPSGGDAPHGHD